MAAVYRLEQAVRYVFVAWYATLRLLNVAPGDIFTIRIFNKPIIMLNSAQAIIDLFEARSGLYSSRPHLTMACDL